MTNQKKLNRDFARLYGYRYCVGFANGVELEADVR